MERYCTECTVIRGIILHCFSNFSLKSNTAPVSYSIARSRLIEQTLRSHVYYVSVATSFVSSSLCRQKPEQQQVLYHLIKILHQKQTQIAHWSFYFWHIQTLTALESHKVKQKKALLGSEIWTCNLPIEVPAHVTSQPPGLLWPTINGLTIDFPFLCKAHNSTRTRRLFLVFVLHLTCPDMVLHNEMSDHKSVIVCALTSIREPQIAPNEQFPFVRCSVSPVNVLINTEKLEPGRAR